MSDATGYPAVASRFSLEIDSGLTIAGWTKVEGLGAEVVMETREEGGTNDFVHQLPTRVKYPNIKLTRPVDEDSAEILKWISEFRTGFAVGQTCEIQAQGEDGEKMISWKIRGIIPVRWTGPQLDANTSNIATETLEIAHHGFLGDK